MMTSWEDIAGVACVDCGKAATHYFGHDPVCCQCHGGDMFTHEEAKAEHARVLSARVHEAVSHQGWEEEETMTFQELTQEVAKREGKKQETNIAQISEITKIVLEVVAEGLANNWVSTISFLATYAPKED
jgi:hypothetical protein